MNHIILYHGSAKEHIVPTYGLGEDRHDYGKVTNVFSTIISSGGM